MHLSYHLNEHYNSVRRIDDPCTKGISPLEEFEIGHDLDKVKKMLGSKIGALDDEEVKETFLEDQMIKYALEKTNKKTALIMKKVLQQMISTKFRSYSDISELT